jgi:type II secretory ATPase GspE/PulE/Tfp pilus assembly ATPase PilB-like protein
MNQGLATEVNNNAYTIQEGSGVMRIGELLIKEGFVKMADVEEALSIQRQEKALAERPLGEILLDTGIITQAELDQLLAHPDLKRTIGSLAVDKRLITRAELESCLKNQKDGQRIGEVLIEAGYLKPADLQQLLREQMGAPRLGELALQLNLVSEAELKAALRIQKGPRILGEILCDLKLVNPLDLYYVLNKYRKQHRLGEVLLDMGYVRKEDLNLALQEQKHSSESLGEILVKKKIITKAQLQEALSRQSNVPFRSLEGFSYSPVEKKTLASLISQRYAEKNWILPISLEGKDLTIGILKPEQIRTARELKALYTNLEIHCVLIPEEKFAEFFEVLYNRALAGMRGLTEDEDEEEGEEKSVDFMQIELDEDIGSQKDEAPVYNVKDIEVEELVNFIIKYGISNGASDIHIEQDRSAVKLRYRIDGVLRDCNIAWLRKKLQEKSGSIISRIKIISNLDIAERRIPQDGVFRINYYDKTKGEKTDLDFRVATCKAIVGENVVIRILDSRNAVVGLESLNHSPHVIEPFKRFVKSSAGMILVTGPTGSGKSSTLYGALKYVYNPTIKIITAEDPIEYSFPGIMQTQVNPKINVTFARLLRSFLRLDPDVILVGEIRDVETSRIGFDAAQTGHLVLSTLHTNDSVSSVSRLLDLQVERSQIAACLSCSLAQRLVRRICPSCAREYVPDEEEWFPFFDSYPTHLRFYKGKGCEACGFTGFKGRTLLSEIFVVDKEIAKALGKGAEVDELRALAISRGMKTMLDDGLLKLKETTLSEILRVIPYEIVEEFRIRNRQEKGSGPPTAGSLLVGGFLVTDPKEEKYLVDQMHMTYENLCGDSGTENGTLDRGLFGDFVTESFQTIRRGYHCRQVVFRVEKKNGKVEVLAVPWGR